MRAADSAAGSVRAQFPGAPGVQCAGVSIKEDRVPEETPFKQDSEDAPAAND